MAAVKSLLQIVIIAARSIFIIGFQTIPFTGVGINQKGSSRFIHLDQLHEKDGYPRPTIWSY